MIKRKIMQLIVTCILIVFMGCDDDWVFNIPEMPEFIIIDAVDYDEWIYYNLVPGEIIATSDIESGEASWDIAFKRNHIKTNGGVSGTEGVCAIVDDSKYWSNDLFNLVTEVPDEECQYDEEISGNMLTSQGCYDPNTHFFVTCDKNPALDQWGYFDSAYHFNVRNYHFFVKDRNDNYIKIWLMSYYDGNGESGRIFFAHKLID